MEQIRRNNREQHNSDEEVIMVLPMEVVEASVLPIEGSAVGLQDIHGSAAQVFSAHAGWDAPFPCFKKERWNTQGVVKIVQQSS